MKTKICRRNIFVLSEEPVIFVFERRSWPISGGVQELLLALCLVLILGGASRTICGTWD